MKLFRWVGESVTNWLVREEEIAGSPFCDFNRIAFDIRPCDVLLVEGRSHVSDVIKTITQSIWTHAALYIGRLYDITDTGLRDLIAQHYNGDPNEQLLIEALLGQGTIVCPLAKYRTENLRICRPRGLSSQDAQKVIAYAGLHLGGDYNVRQLLDLARFMFPYTVLPRRWRSSLFEHHAGRPTQTVCSTMIAEAFASVKFPVLPVIQQDANGHLRLYKRNTRLYTPRDFDYSPYFEIIKYPVLGIDDISLYQRLPWDEDGIVCNDEGDCYPARVSPPAAETTSHEDLSKPSPTQV